MMMATSVTETHMSPSQGGSPLSWPPSLLSFLQSTCHYTIHSFSHTLLVCLDYNTGLTVTRICCLHLTSCLARSRLLINICCMNECPSALKNLYYLRSKWWGKTIFFTPMVSITEKKRQWLLMERMELYGNYFLNSPEKSWIVHTKEFFKRCTIS